MKSLRDPNRKPTHPGEVLREDVLPSLGVTQTDLARHLGVSRLSVSELLLEKRAMTPDMAMRVAAVTGTTPQSWRRMQEALDLWTLAKDRKRYAAIERLRPFEAASA